jgi:hypothetical protein
LDVANAARKCLPAILLGLAVLQDGSKEEARGRPCNGREVSRQKVMRD